MRSHYGGQDDTETLRLWRCEKWTSGGPESFRISLRSLRCHQSPQIVSHSSPILNISAKKQARKHIHVPPRNTQDVEELAIELVANVVQGLLQVPTYYVGTKVPPRRFMAIVIVMGSFQDPWHYSFLKAELNKAGYKEVTIVQLPSTGGWTPVENALAKDIKVRRLGRNAIGCALSHKGLSSNIAERSPLDGLFTHPRRWGEGVLSLRYSLVPSKPRDDSY